MVSSPLGALSLDALKHQAHVFLTEKLRYGTPEFGMLFYIVFAYWSLAVFYDVLDHLPFTWIQKYKVTRKDVGRGNRMTRFHVICRVLLQHAFQTVLGMGLMIVDPDMCKAGRTPESLPQRCVRFVLGMFIMDTYQFWLHRYMHLNKFLYKHLHSWHHTLTIPYAYGALYNTILEGFLLDSVGGALTHYAAGLDCTTATCLMTFATCKTVLDHCNYRFPLNPLHDLFPNSCSYHDVHHDYRHLARNFSQPFFTHWDWLCGSFTDPRLLHLTVEEVEAKLLADKRAARQPAKLAQASSTRSGTLDSARAASSLNREAAAPAGKGSKGTAGTVYHIYADAVATASAVEDKKVQ